MYRTCMYLYIQSAANTNKPYRYEQTVIGAISPSQKRDSSFILYGHSPSHYWECTLLFLHYRLMSYAQTMSQGNLSTHAYTEQWSTDVWQSPIIHSPGGLTIENEITFKFAALTLTANLDCSFIFNLISISFTC